MGLYEVFQRAAWTWRDPAHAARAAIYADRNADLDLNLRVPPYAGE